MIEIHLLEQLSAFAKYGTLSKAAEEIHTSQPALTRSMRKLEEELGVPLFIRTRNHLELNDTGRLAAECADRVLASDRDMISRVKAYDRSLHTISIAYCAPVPQAVLTPIINNVYDGMTISAVMGNDAEYIDRLKEGEFQLVLIHWKPDDPDLFYKKCGHEDLFISLTSSNPLTFYPEIHLRDLNGQSVLLYSRIGFWMDFPKDTVTDVKFLLQVQRDSFEELTGNSDFPCFASSYYIRRNQAPKDRIQVSIIDDFCHQDYYLVCTQRDKKRYAKLFDQLRNDTIY